jgi:hypothetical protein
MLTDRPLRIEVLINSPGPHDQVRVRDPFSALQQLGIDCRIHERPFRFSSCIRPHSMVIWQRPLPESRQRQWEHLQWLRERGCLLLTEWDDHPTLFPESIRTSLEAMEFAPLELCHGLHTSCTKLAQQLRAIQPLGLVLENRVADIPTLNLQKHTSERLRVLVANQNRGSEHEAISVALQRWAEQCGSLQVVVVADRRLASQVPPRQLEYHDLLDYRRYRRLLGTCQMALLPLANGKANACKTPIKLLECAGESVATVCGPELYGRWAPESASTVVNQLTELVPYAQTLASNLDRLKHQVTQAHRWVEEHWRLDEGLNMRHWLYQQLWRRRRSVDQTLVERLSHDKRLPRMQESDFGCRHT